VFSVLGAYLWASGAGAPRVAHGMEFDGGLEGVEGSLTPFNHTPNYTVLSLNIQWTWVCRMESGHGPIGVSLRILVYLVIYDSG